MEKCCPNPYYECGAWLGCCNSIAIRIPDAYTNSEITVEFMKSFGKILSAKIGVTVIAGWVLINLEALPEGYINSYAGPYSVRFLDSSMTVFPFTAKDGKTYTKASFDTMLTTTAEDIAQLNFIDNQVY